MKFLSTEPTPISTGRPHGFYDDSMFDDVLGIELFNPAGDLNGVALVSGGAISVNFECVGALQGTDYPVMTVAMHVRPDALPGSQSQFDLDPSTAFTVNYLPAIVKPIAPATITVGGSISVTNVAPGGGVLPAGTVVKIEGLGFERRTQVQLSGIPAQSVAVVSPTEIDIVLQQATNMTGKKIQVVNPDGSQDTYFSYMRGINLRASNQPMLAHAVPIFSSATHSQAAFTPVAPGSADQFSGLAMQNQNLEIANVTVTLYSAYNQALSSTAIRAAARIPLDGGEFGTDGTSRADGKLRVGFVRPADPGVWFPGEFGRSNHHAFPRIRRTAINTSSTASTIRHWLQRMTRGVWPAPSPVNTNAAQ